MAQVRCGECERLVAVKNGKLKVHTVPIVRSACPGGGRPA